MSQKCSTFAANLKKGGNMEPLTLQQAVAKFNEAYENNRQFLDRKSNFYCGITNDLSRRSAEHEVEAILYSVTADTFETARQLEWMLHNEGYDTGAQVGHGMEDSKIVYMYRKGRNTVQ